MNRLPDWLYANILLACILFAISSAESITAVDDSLRSEIQQMIDKGVELQSRRSIEQIDSAYSLFNSAANLAVGTFGFYDTLHAWSLFRLGENRIYAGDVISSVAFANRMKQVVDSAFSNDLKLNIYCLALMGDSYVEANEYSRALAFYHQEIALLNDPAVDLTDERAMWLVNALSDVACTEEVIGERPEQVLRDFDAALELTEERLGRDHPRYGATLGNIGWHYIRCGDYTNAEKYLTEALVYVRRKFAPADNRPVTYSVWLADCLRMRGEYSAADSILKLQFAIIDSSFGDQHPRLSHVLRSQAELLAAQDSLDRALEVAQRMVDICRQPSGFPTRVLMAAMQRLGKIAIADRKHKLVADMVTELSQTRHSYLMNVFRYASESQKLSFVRQSPPIEPHLLAGITASPSKSTLQAAVNMVLRGKGLAIDAMAAEQTAALCSRDPFLDSLLAEHREVSGKIGGLVFASPGYGREAEILKGLFANKDELEAEISASCSNLKFFNELEKVSSLAVASTLPPAAVLLELVRYEDYDYSRICRKQDTRFAYAVITLSPSGDHSIIELGEAGTLDSLIEEYHAIMADALLQQWTGGTTEAMNRYADISSRLYERLIAPLETTLEGTDRVYVSADGLLNLLPFETLTRDGKRYLIEDHQFVYLTSGRDLLKERYETDSREAIVMADPDYMVDPTTLPAFAAESQTMFATRGNAMTPECLASMVSSLPLSREEGSTVAGLLGERGNLNTSYLVSGEAREGTLKNLAQAPRVLHIATHGYFCPEADREALSNPLLRSGLVLAGANRTIGHLDEDRPDTGEDGILTALEASGLNLIGTDLVVLSACQTGIGEVQSGEGVFGLRRAFQHAGARSLVMSMFAVPDQSTSELMEHFYENWLSGQSKSSALRKASLSILNERRANGESTHPLFWGGFILVGDPN